MSPVTIGTTTVETTEIVSFDFNLHEPAAKPGVVEHMVLHATLRDGSRATTEGDEAVTLKVLLASIGLVDQHRKGTHGGPPHTDALKLKNLIRNSPSVFF